MNWYEKYAQEDPDGELIEELNREYRSKWIPVNSSFVKEVYYEEKSGTLSVKIKTGGLIKEYNFIGVPKNLYENFLQSPSKGTFFNTILKREKRIASNSLFIIAMQ